MIRILPALLLGAAGVVLLLVGLPGTGDGGPRAAPTTTEVFPTTPPADGDPGAPNHPYVFRPPFEGERHLARLRQLTFGGENAEAYWSFGEDRLIFQSRRGRLAADQIFVMDAWGKNVEMVSTGKGRTTCSYFLPGDRRILYASTHLAGAEAPAIPEHDPRVYVWPIFSSYDVFVRELGAPRDELVNLTHSPGYDAEATVSPKGDRIVFTSTRAGDIDLYTMKIDGTDVRRLTTAPGYDGGAYYSWDGRKIVWRAPRPEDVDVSETKALLARQLVRPTRLEIWIMDADGRNKTMVTDNGAANFAPFWCPDDRHVIFASNQADPNRRNFELYLVDTVTKDQERVTFFARTRPGAQGSDDFDGFPMFTHDGKRLVFCSNRFNDAPNETNVFVADWRD